MLSPDYILHADWSRNPAKRWITAARLRADGSYLAGAPQAAAPPVQILGELRSLAAKRARALLGCDFPIGLPCYYARQAGIPEFLPALRRFGRGIWKEFFHVAETAAQISLYRPFYPQRPGNASQSDLLRALGAGCLDQLRRKCELPHQQRRAAAPLFWTMGGQQVGKAAISGWKELLQPALSDPALSFQVWPFNGKLSSLLQPGKIVVAETYPAEFYRPLKVTFSPRRKGQKSGKRSLADRQANARVIREAGEQLGLILSPDALQVIDSGFGNALTAEDAFDSFTGLLGMLMVVRGRLPHSPPPSPDIAAIEGWILGQPAPELT